MLPFAKVQKNGGGCYFTIHGNWYWRFVGRSTVAFLNRAANRFQSVVLQKSKNHVTVPWIQTPRPRRTGIVRFSYAGRGVPSEPTRKFRKRSASGGISVHRTSVHRTYRRRCARLAPLQKQEKRRTVLQLSSLSFFSFPPLLSVLASFSLSLVAPSHPRIRRARSLHEDATLCASERVIRLRRESVETFGSFASPLDSLSLSLSFSRLRYLVSFVSLPISPLHSCPSFFLTSVILSLHLSHCYHFLSFSLSVSLFLSLHSCPSFFLSSVILSLYLTLSLVSSTYLSVSLFFTTPVHFPCPSLPLTYACVSMCNIRFNFLVSLFA